MIERKIDDLGRIVIPQEMRRSLGIGAKTPLSINLVNEDIIIKKITPSCRICGSVDKLNSKLMVCEKCIKKIKDSN